MAKNSICHFEIAARDVKKAGEFYRDLFGWKLDHSMGDEYILFRSEGAPGGGIGRSENFTPGTGVVVYIEVDDIGAYLKKAVKLGGAQTVPKTEIPNVGWFGHFTDPEGNTIGLFTGK